MFMSFYYAREALCFHRAFIHVCVCVSGLSTCSSLRMNGDILIKLLITKQVTFYTSNDTNKSKIDRARLRRFLA